MTDEQRAGDLLTGVAAADTGRQAADIICDHFAAVRAEERRAIVAAIKTAVNQQNASAGAPVRLRNYATSLMHVALGAIERGEHGA